MMCLLSGPDWTTRAPLPHLFARWDVLALFFCKEPLSAAGALCISVIHSLRLSVSFSFFFFVLHSVSYTQPSSSLRAGLIGGDRKEEWELVRAMEQQSILPVCCVRPGWKPNYLCLWEMDTFGSSAESSRRFGGFDGALRHDCKAFWESRTCQRTADSLSCSCYTAKRDPSH